jgi:hypothetical protein
MNGSHSSGIIEHTNDGAECPACVMIDEDGDEWGCSMGDSAVNFNHPWLPEIQFRTR